MTDRSATTRTLANGNDATVASTPRPDLSPGSDVISRRISVPVPSDQLLGASASAELLREGAIVRDKYRLKKRLGKGGMGEVWLATHLELKTDVAIKFVHESLTSRGSQGRAILERFRFEAQIAARLAAGTRHVVAVHDTGEFEGCPFLVMEYVPGRTLDDEIERNGKLDPARFAAILDQVADALDAAHAQGIVHRDLKPPNILLVDQRDGSTLVKVADFGVAKALGDNIPLDKPKETAAGHIVGSPSFMSPEQIGGDEVDARSDIWSLGAVAYEVLTGRTCFDGATFRELMVAIMTGPTPSICAVRPDVPSSIDRWLGKALAKKATDRFASASEMARAYRDALKPPAARDALKPPAAPRRRLLPYAVLGALGAAAIAALIVMLALRGEQSPATQASVPITPAPLDNPAAIAPNPNGQPGVVSPVVSPVPAVPTIASPATAPIATAPAPRASPSAEPSTTRPRPVKRIDPSEIQ